MFGCGDLESVCEWYAKEVCEMERVKCSVSLERQLSSGR